MAEEGPRDTDILVDDDAETHSVRTYRNSAGDVVSLYLAIWREHRSRTRHPPELCYKGSGYRILEQKTVQLQVADQLAIPVRVLLLERHGERICVLYWYQRGDDILLFSYWRRRATWTFRGEGVWPPLVKVMFQMPASDAEKAESQLKSIAAPLFGWTKYL
jgi:EpsI family protein